MPCRLVTIMEARPDACEHCFPVANGGLRYELRCSVRSWAFEAVLSRDMPLESLPRYPDWNAEFESSRAFSAGQALASILDGASSRID